MILLIILLIVIFLYTQRENFTGEGKLTDFLNTWHATNDELSNIMTPSDNRINFKKHMK